MPIKVNYKNIERIIKTDASGQPIEIVKVYRNNVVIWKKKSPYTPEQLAKMAEQTAYLINQERNALGLGSLYMVPHLNECAEIRAKEQVELEGHWRPDGEYCSKIIDKNKLSWLATAENIASGSLSAEDAINDWKSSQYNWASAMNNSYTHTGVGVYYDENSTHKWYWVQIFTNDVEPFKVYPDQYLPQCPDIHDQIIVKCIDSETGENISGINISLQIVSGAATVKADDFSAAQNGVEISVPVVFDDDWVQFTTGTFPTKISGVSTCKLRIALFKSHLKNLYTYSHGLDGEDSNRYFSVFSVNNIWGKIHRFTIVLNKQ